MESLELKINKWLSEGADSASVAKKLSAMWKNGELRPQEREAAADFFVNAKQFAILLELVPLCLEREMEIPWSAFIETLTQTQANLTSNEWEQIFTGAREQGCLQKVQHTEPYRMYCERVDDILVPGAPKTKKDEMLVVKGPSVEFLNTLDLKENKKKSQPLESENDVWDDLNLHEAAKDSSESEMDETYLLVKDEKAEMSEKIIFEEYERAVKRDPSVAYDSAISIMGMGFTDAALRILDMGNPHPAHTWLRIELLQGVGRLEEALELVSGMECVTGENDSQIMAKYAKASILYKMGRSELAVKLLKEVIEIKPHYRIADILLKEWESGL